MVEEVEFAGLLRRFAATIIDTLILVILITPLSYLFAQGASPMVHFGWSNLLINDLLPMVLVIFFWVRYRATPGKMLMDCQVVDATTFDNLRIGQSILRYVGYFISMLPLGLGFFWIIWDKKRRGFHDLLAHTVVIRLPANHYAAIEADKSIEELMKEVE